MPLVRLGRYPAIYSARCSTSNSITVFNNGNAEAQGINEYLVGSSEAIS
jgi:hypothetical protein